MVNNAVSYKLNNTHIGLCASRGKSQWNFFSFCRQIDPVVSIHTYSQNVVWRKKKEIKKKNQYKYICKRPQPYWSTYVKHFLKQRYVFVCVFPAVCVCACVLQGGREKTHESFLWKYGLRSEELIHRQAYALSITSFLKLAHRSNITTLLVFFRKDSAYRGVIRSNIWFVTM